MYCFKFQATAAGTRVGARAAPVPCSAALVAEPGTSATVAHTRRLPCVFLNGSQHFRVCKCVAEHPTAAALLPPQATPPQAASDSDSDGLSATYAREYECTSL